MTSKSQDCSTQAAPVPTWRRSLVRLVLVLLAVATTCTIWLALRATLIPYLAQRYTLESFRLLYGEKPNSALPEGKKGLPRRGQINGVPISVPLEYMTYYPVEYKDKSIWEGRKPGDKKPEERTYDDAIGAFTIYAHWPDMQSRNPDNWLSVTVHPPPPGNWRRGPTAPPSDGAAGRDGFALWRSLFGGNQTDSARSFAQHVTDVS